MAQIAAPPTLIDESVASEKIAAVRCAEKPSLKSRVMRGSMWIYLSSASVQAMRFGSNMLLARLLAPDDFGLMAIVLAIVQGLQLLSDMGVNISIIQNERGDEPSFLNTAFTIQAIRGIGLWLCSVALAWPVSIMYDNPMLMWLIPTASLSAVFLGFTSTSLATLTRRLQLGKTQLLDTGTQLAAVLITITLAFSIRSVWALAIGATTGSMLRMVISHFIVPIERVRFQWDRKAAASMFHFGKWIFLSTAMFFVVAQGDRLLLGLYVSMSVLGVYWVAVMISETVVQQVTRLVHTVLFPAFSEMMRDDPGRMREIYYRARLVLDGIAMISLGGLAITGSWLISYLYPTRFMEAGWILQALCIRAAMSCLLAPCETCLLSMGHTKYGFFRNLGRAVWIMAGIPIGWHMNGIEGVVLVLALSEIPCMLVLWNAASKHQVFNIWLEVRSFAFGVLGVLLGVGFLAIVT